jgi:ABC-type Fe3+ transport system substrate-binding protein
MASRRNFIGMAAGLSAAALSPTRSRAADAGLVAAARREGQVVWYTTMVVDQAVTQMAAAFEQKFPGIKLLHARGDDASNTVKIITELRAGSLQADVFDGFSSVAPLRHADLLAKYVPEAAALYPPELKDPDGYWTGVNMTVYEPGVNTDLIARARFPNTFEDLLDPGLKGKMVWNPTNTTAAPLFVGHVLEIMGDEAGTKFLRRLAGQDIARLELSARAILDHVIAGDYALGLMMSEVHAIASAQKGAPVDWIRMQPAAVTVVVAGVLKAAPHPNAARLLVEYMTSAEGQAVLARNTYLPALPGVPPVAPNVTPAQGGFTAIYRTGIAIEKKLPDWIRITNELFH